MGNIESASSLLIRLEQELLGYGFLIHPPIQAGGVASTFQTLREASFHIVLRPLKRPNDDRHTKKVAIYSG